MQELPESRMLRNLPRDRENAANSRANKFQKLAIDVTVVDKEQQSPCMDILLHKPQPKHIGETAQRDIWFRLWLLPLLLTSCCY